MMPPFDPPVADPEQSGVHVCSPWPRLGISIFALIQLGISCVSFAAVASYVFEPNADPSRYQFLIAPILMWVLSVPVLVASVFVCRRVRHSITAFESVWYNGTSLLPTIGAASVFFAPYLSR